MAMAFKAILEILEAILETSQSYVIRLLKVYARTLQTWAGAFKVNALVLIIHYGQYGMLLDGKAILLNRLC